MKEVLRIILPKYNRALGKGEGFRSYQDYTKRVKRISKTGIRFHPYNLRPSEAAPDWPRNVKSHFG